MGNFVYDKEKKGMIGYKLWVIMVSFFCYNCFSFISCYSVFFGDIYVGLMEYFRKKKVIFFRYFWEVGFVFVEGIFYVYVLKNGFEFVVLC